MFPIRDHNPSGRVPYVSYALIALNVVIYLLYGFRPEPEVYMVYDRWAMIPAVILSGENLETLITCMFLHGGIMHLLGNMLFLFIFGDNLEDYLGHVPFLVFYLLSGIAASGLQIIADMDSVIPVVGASGAIAGVMGGYLLLYPKARVDVLFIIIILIRIVPLPAFAVLGMWFGLQVVLGVVEMGGIGAGGGVAYWAHAGGFVAGAALIAASWLVLERPKARRPGPWDR